MKALPARFTEKVVSWTGRFLSGIVPLKGRFDYLVVAVLSIAIWFCYALTFQLSLYAFDLVSIYNLAWYG